MYQNNNAANTEHIEMLHAIVQDNGLAACNQKPSKCDHMHVMEQHSESRDHPYASSLGEKIEPKQIGGHSCQQLVALLRTEQRTLSYSQRDETSKQGAERRE